jgi:hypothetical protein
MSEANHPKVIFSEWLSTGVIVRFEDGVSVFYSAEFLSKNRNDPSNKVFGEYEAGGAHC